MKTHCLPTYCSLLTYGPVLTTYLLTTYLRTALCSLTGLYLLLTYLLLTYVLLSVHLRACTYYYLPTYYLPMYCSLITYGPAAGDKCVVSAVRAYPLLLSLGDPQPRRAIKYKV